MRVALPLLVTAVLAGTSMIGADPASASTATSAAQVSISAHAKAKAKKPHKRLARLRVVITGSPRGRVHVRGPHTHRSVSKSSMFPVRSGRFHMHAHNVSLHGDSYVPVTRSWTFTISKGSTTLIDVSYSQAGSSSPGSVDTDTPPAGMVGELFTLVNQVRAQGRECGTDWMPTVDPLAYDSRLAQAAQAHADDMNLNNYFEHDSLDGRTFSDRIRRAGYSGNAAGENIAMGFQTATEVMSAWLDSPGHCLNIMDPDFDDMGLGLASQGDTDYSAPLTYWVQEFGYASDRM